jgi:hypothetical protein
MNWRRMFNKSNWVGLKPADMDRSLPLQDTLGSANEYFKSLKRPEKGMPAHSRCQGIDPLSVDVLLYVMFAEYVTMLWKNDVLLNKDKAVVMSGPDVFHSVDGTSVPAAGGR